VYILSYSQDSLSSPNSLDNVPTFTMALREYPQGSKILASRVAPGKRSHSPIVLVRSSALEYACKENRDMRAGSRPVIRIWVGGWVGAWVDALVDAWMHGWMGGCVGGWMCGRVGGWEGGWVGGWGKKGEEERRGRERGRERQITTNDTMMMDRIILQFVNNGDFIAHTQMIDTRPPLPPHSCMGREKS